MDRTPGRAGSLGALLFVAVACGRIDEGEPDAMSSSGGDSSEANESTGASEAVEGSGGTTAGTGGNQGEDVDCPSLSQTQCAAESSCHRLVALAVDTESRCWTGPPVYHGCDSASCSGAPLVAQAPDDSLWLFGDGCIPDGWHQVKTFVSDECQGD